VHVEFGPRLRLAHTPTPIARLARLGERLGVELWVKRDDATGGVEAGNKVRKLEFLLGEALDQGADTLITCGAIQSNHCRATAALAARLGLACVAFLRTADVTQPLPATGNVLLMRMLGAELHLIGPAEYRERNALMSATAETLRRTGRRPYVIPEGGSNALGSLGYVEAMREIRTQLDYGLGGGRGFDLIVHACGSGGTAAGTALGAARYGVAPRIMAVAVCDDRAYFERVAAGIFEEARRRWRSLDGAARLDFDDRWKGPGYAATTPEQRRFLVQMAREHGLVLDPVYTGKALFGLAGAIAADPSLLGKRVLFLHTGGLPGLLADGHELASDL
jgi:D-cysteine desulfhydrase